jgi:zinc protease
MTVLLNRKTPPTSQELKTIHIPEGQKISMANGVDIHYINAGTSDVLRIDFVFDAGSRKQTRKAIALTTNGMLSEGTKTYSAQQIANELDFFGAYFQTRCHVDDSIVSLYCLKKHFSSCLPYVIDVLSNSYFPDNELITYKQNAIQRLLVNQEKNSFLCRRAFYSSVFGSENPYGSYSESVDYEIISRETLVDFFNTHYRNNIKYILIAGSVDAEILEQTKKTFSLINSRKATNSPIISSSLIVEKQFIDKQDSVQSAIRIGRQFFNRKHPDYRKMQLLNLVLGGYFGSRLMKNIREDKGLTYGIYSSLESYLDSGCFYVDTDINNDLRVVGIKEIYKEINDLRNRLIPEDELALAKNYMLGSFLRSIDGPFSLADRHKILVDYGLDYQFYYDFVDIIKQTSAEELRDLANKYLKKEDLSEIVVGKK